MSPRPELGHYRFCPLCGAALVVRPDGNRDRLSCPACTFVYYHNPVPAAGGLICRSGRVCLVRRAIAPRRGDWTLPAGFMEYDESSEQCAAREIAEETGLSIAVEELLGVYMGFDDPRHRAVLLVYWVRELENRVPAAGDDAEAVEFFRPDEIPDNIAFRAHRQALDDAFAHPRFRLSETNR